MLLLLIIKLIFNRLSNTKIPQKMYLFKSDESFCKTPCTSRKSERVHPPHVFYTHYLMYIYMQRDCNGSLSDDDVPQTDPDTSESEVRPSRNDNDVIYYDNI